MAGLVFLGLIVVCWVLSWWWDKCIMADFASRRTYLIKNDTKPVTPTGAYNTYAELKDMIIHMERVALGIRSEIYAPIDKDFKELALQLFALTNQIKTFLRNKANVGAKE